jgi:site-specific DNA-methyltransferase (adenine-specific)
MNTFVPAIGKNSLSAYLVEMAVRLVELRRVLKDTGSLYLHCDPTASHYLKIILDAIFGVENFLNEVIWMYGLGGSSSRYWPRKHDVILWYSKTPDGQYFEADMIPAKSNAMKGLLKKAPDYWDIPSLNNMAAERLGYPTQKPLALLERIIRSSCPPDGIVLDPFCGCGTAVAAAQVLGRKWIGIDITYLAIAVMKKRLLDHFPELGRIRVVGAPTEMSGLRKLAADDVNGRYQVQWWALDQLGATPRDAGKKQGADGGIDGIISFSDVGGEYKSVIVSVKSGGVQVKDVRELQAVVEREKAAIGVLFTVEEPTRPMRNEAAQAGFWHSDLFGKDYAKIQIISAQEVLENGKKPDLPPLISEQYRKAERIQRKAGDQGELFANEQE